MARKKLELKPFFCPKSLAIVGVSTGRYRFGGVSFLDKLIGCHFPGKIYPVNPKAGEIRGLKAYSTLSSLPEVPELAMVCVPAGHVPDVLRECGRLGVGCVHILSSGFKETQTEKGKELEKEILSISNQRGLLVIGPNCMGGYCPSARFTPWGAIPGLNGPVGVISQSGAMAQRLAEYLCSFGVGVHKAVSFGNAAVLDATHFLEFMAGEDQIRVIAMYLESIQDGRRLFELSREINRSKPIILWKGGESEAGARTAASHTGAISGERRLWNAFFRQTGVIQVRSMTEWGDAIIALCLLPAPAGKGVFLIGGGGGKSVTQSDRCVREGLAVPKLSEETMARLCQSGTPAGSIPGNPLDLFQIYLDADFLGKVLDLGYNDPNVAMLAVDRLIPRKAFHLPDVTDSNPVVIRFLKKRRDRKPTVFIVDTEGGDPDLAAKGTELRSRFCKAGIPAYPSLQRAASALSHLYHYHACIRKII